MGVFRDSPVPRHPHGEEEEEEEPRFLPAPSSPGAPRKLFPPVRPHPHHAERGGPAGGDRPGHGAIALYLIRQASMATGDGFPEGLWPIAIAITAFWVLPAVALGGALGGSFRRPAGASPEPEL